MAKRPGLKDQVGDRYVSLDHFYRKQELDPATGCMNWTGVTNNIGYGFTAFYSISKDKPGMMTTHRLALMIKLGREIKPGMNANHYVCHNRLCCNPDHIEEGTQQEKMAAMREQGILLNVDRPERVAYNHKQHGRNYKYSEADIQWIRFATVADIAAKYNIPVKRAGAMRCLMRNGYTWLPYDKSKIVRLKTGRKKRTV